MWKDPVVEEVRKARQNHAAQFGYDLRAIYNDLKATEKIEGRKVVSFPSKRLKKKKSANRVAALERYIHLNSLRAGIVKDLNAL